MLTTTELRKLVRAHNILSKITIPKGSNRDDIIKIIEKNGYKVNHEEKKLEQKVKRGRQLTLKKAEEITKPKPKTAEQIKKTAERKIAKAEEKQKEIKLAKKEAVKEFKKKQKEAKKIIKKDIKDKSKSISKVENKKMPPKITAEQMKSIKVIEPKKEKKEAPAIKEIKEAPPIKEKVETLEEKLFRILKYVISQYNKLPSQYGYVDMPQKRKDKLINTLGSIIDKKKTSNFTKTETEVLQRAIKFLKSDKAEEDVKTLEAILEKKEEEVKVDFSVGDKVSFSFPTDKSITIDGEVEKVNKNSYTITFEETPEIKEAMDKNVSTGFRFFKRDGKKIIKKTYTAKQLQK
jgi:hypothetical protein